MLPLTPEQAEHLVNTVLSGPSIERPSALFNLVKTVYDPNGNADHSESALNLLRAIDCLTKEYETWFQERVTSPIALEIAMHAPI
jgi:hypothetical protein